MIKAILFDFDGTLVDSAPGILRTMAETYQSMGLPVPVESDMRATIGLQLRRALQMLNHLSDEDAALATQTYENLFPTVGMRNLQFFPKVIETLHLLHDRGLRLAICTSRGAESLDMIIHSHGLSGVFETRVTNSDHLAPKPAPDMVLTLLSRMSLNADEALVVGDTSFDIEMGNAAGCPTVAVTYGYHPVERLRSANPTRIIDCFDQITKLLPHFA